MNFSLAALSLSTIIMVNHPQACFGFITSNSEPATNAATLRPSQDVAEPIIGASTDAAVPPRVFFVNGPKAALAAAMIKELCKDYVAEERGDLSDEEFIDECFI